MYRKNFLSSMVGLLAGSLGFGATLTQNTFEVGLPGFATGFRSDLGSGPRSRSGSRTPKQGKRNAHYARRQANKRARKARVLNAQIRRGVR